MEIGQVIGATTLRGFRFVIKEGMEKHVRRDEFISVKESVTGKEILGIIKEITISNELLPDEFGRDIRLEEIILNEGEYPVPTVKILGCEEEHGLELPRYGIRPGAGVKLATDDTLKKILKQDEKKSAFVGTLSTRKSIPVYVSINDIISRHCAVLAMTGAGKSYTVGVLIEELMKKKGSVVVIDAHGEYKGVKIPGSKTKVYDIRGENRIRIEASSLRISDFSNLIPDITDPQRDLLDEILTRVSKFYEKFDLDAIVKVLNVLYDIKEGIPSGDEILPDKGFKELAKKVTPPTIGALLRRVERLKRMDLFDVEGTPLDDIVSRNQLTILDLSDADERVSETIVASVARKIFNERKRYVKDKEGDCDTPTFLIIEEAHNFAPRVTEERDVLSKYILRKIAREGRKFGVGLCIVSQRPGKLDADVLSQCNTQIIMKIVNPADQEYIRQSVESVTEDIVRDLPSLSRGEAIIVGSAIRLPVPVRIRTRETEVRGEDIDIVGAWSKE